MMLSYVLPLISYCEKEKQDVKPYYIIKGRDENDGGFTLWGIPIENFRKTDLYIRKYRKSMRNEYQKAKKL